MKYRFDRAKVWTGGTFQDECFHFSDATVSSESVISGHEVFIFPGFCDVHVHFRQP